jgi:hypothetical protein
MEGSSSLACASCRRRCTRSTRWPGNVETDAGPLDGDIMVVALGADLDPAATPGLLEAGHEFYTVDGAFAAREVIDDFAGGRVIIGVLSTPYKCPPAPSETALLLHENLVARGLWERSEIALVVDFARPIPPSPDASAVLLFRRRRHRRLRARRDDRSCGMRSSRGWRGSAGPRRYVWAERSRDRSARWLPSGVALSLGERRLALNTREASVRTRRCLETTLDASTELEKCNRARQTGRGLPGSRVPQPHEDRQLAAAAQVSEPAHASPRLPADVVA